MAYKIVRSSRRTVGISIHPTGEVVIKVPLRLSIKKIEEIIGQKQGWIDSKMQELEAKGFFAKTGKKYESGEELLFLGQNYKIRIIQHSKNHAEIVSDEILIYKKESADTKSVLLKFFSQKADEIFTARMSICFEYFLQFFVCKKPSVRVRKMKSRWGSCSSKGIITLNSLLIHATLECIDYVIFHELCHLKHGNHSADFYLLQGLVNPRWKEDKTLLESFMGEIASIG